MADFSFQIWWDIKFWNLEQKNSSTFSRNPFLMFCQMKPSWKQPQNLYNSRFFSFSHLRNTTVDFIIFFSSWRKSFGSMSGNLKIDSLFQFLLSNIQIGRFFALVYMIMMEADFLIASFVVLLRVIPFYSVIVWKFQVYYNHGQNLSFTSSCCMITFCHDCIVLFKAKIHSR